MEYLDLSKLGPDPQIRLSQLLPIYISLESISKVHLVQSIVSMILVKNIFNLYFVGLPTEICASLMDMERNLESLGTISSVQSYQKRHSYIKQSLAQV